MRTITLEPGFNLQQRSQVQGIRTIQPRNGQEGVLDVLGAPFFGPVNGRDALNTFFSPRTDFMRHLLPYPPVMYWHGQATNSRTTPIGEVRSRWEDAEGEWFEVHLDLTTEEGQRVWNASKVNRAFGSTGAVPATIDIGDDGEILQWMVGELTLVDLEPDEGRVPANFYAVATPRVEAIARTHMSETARTTFLEGTVLLEGGSAEAPQEPDEVDDIVVDEDEPDNNDDEADEESADTNSEESTMTPEEMAAAIEALQTGMAEMQDSVRTLVANATPAADPEAEQDDPTRTQEVDEEPDADADESQDDPRVAELQQQVATMRTDLAAREHASWVGQMITQGRVVPSEQETLLTALATSYSTGGEQAVSTLRTVVEAREPVAAIDPNASLRVAGFQENNNQQTVDDSYMSRLSGYVAAAGHSPQVSGTTTPAS